MKPTKHTTTPFGDKGAFIITSAKFGYKFIVSPAGFDVPTVWINSVEQYNDFQDCYTYAWGLFLELRQP